MKEKTKKRFISLIAVSAMMLFSLIGCVGQVQKYEEEIPKTFVNEKLDFTLSDPVNTPEAKESSSRGAQIEKLVTYYAQSYENDEYLKEDVILFRQWQWGELYKSLEKKVKDNPKWLNTYRLQAEVYLTNSKYEAALSSLDQVLRVNHDDVYALGLSAYVQHLLGNSEQKTARLKALEKVSPKCKNDVVELINFVSNEINQEHGKGLNDPTKVNYDSVGVLGVAPTPTGDISTGGILRIKETVKAAYLVSKGNVDKNPKIIISGGALDTHYSEAEVMKNYLLRNANTIANTLGLGVVPADWTIYGDQVVLDTMARDTVGNAVGILKEVSNSNLENLLVIGSKDQVMRADCIFKSYAEANKLNVQITTAECSSSDPTSNQTKYAYICSAVAYGLFTKDDFARHKKVSILQASELHMTIGKVVCDKESYDQGEIASVNVVPAAGYEVDTMTAQTSSGAKVEITNGKVKIGSEDIFVNATFKPLANSSTVSFFHQEYYGTTQNGDTTISTALERATNAIREVNANVVSVTDNIHIEASDPNNALGYGKMGGFGLGSSSRIGGFKITFAEKYLVQKVVVTAVRLAEGEGRISINGQDPSKGALQGVANTFDVSYTVEFDFATPTNVIDLKTVAENGNFGRVILYGMTFFTASSVKEYAIDVNKFENGSVSLPTRAVAGAVIKIDVKTNDGYFVDKIMVTSGNSEIKLTSGNTFVMPEGDVKIDITLVFRLVVKTNVMLQGSKVYNDDSTVIASVKFNKDAYEVNEEASFKVNIGHGFELVSLSAKTKSGSEVALSKNNSFKFAGEDVIFTVICKMIDKTFTISFFNSEIYEKGGNGITDIEKAYAQVSKDIKAVNSNLVEVNGDNKPKEADEKNALGYGKAGGFGLAAGGRIGWFTMKFNENYKIKKVVVNVSKNSATEGTLKVNGKIQSKTYNNGKLQGLPQQYNYENLAEYVLDKSTNIITLETYSETVNSKKNYGRVIVYTVTLYLD